MARLPQPGGDSGNWGDVLNDFLSQAHTSTGAIKPGAVTKADVGLGSADNTPDASKPVSAPQQAAINAESAARTAADSAALALARANAIYPGNKFGFLGDSIVWGYPSGKNAWPSYAAAFSNGRIQKIKNAGISDNKTTDMLARLDADVISQGVNVCVVAGGVNDVDENVPEATTRANLTAIYTSLESAGIRPILWCVLPNTTFTDAKKAQIITLNAWIKDYAASHFYDVINLFDLALDSVTGGMKTSWTTDGIHPSMAYQIIGRAVSDFITPRLPLIASPLATAATERRSLVDNALMLVDTNADGVPDSFSASFGAGYTHSIQTPLVGTDVVGSWAVVTMATAATSRRLEWTTATTRLALGLAFASPGDRIAFAVRMSLAPGADAVGASVYMQLEGVTVATAVGSMTYAVDGVGYGEATIPTGWTGRVHLVMTTGNGAGVYKIAQPVILNLTRLGSSAASIADPGTTVPGDGLSGTLVNGVVASDTFNRTAADLVGTSPTVGRTAWSGQTGRISVTGTRAKSLGVSSNVVILDTLARGDFTVSVDAIQISTQESATKSTRLYCKYLDASNNVFINVGANTTAVITVYVRIAGAQTSAITFPAGTIPTNTAAADYPASISIIGTALSATVNGVTRTATLSSGDATALANASKVGFTSDSTTHEWENLSVTVAGTYL